MAHTAIDKVLAESALASPLPWNDHEGLISDASGMIVCRVFRRADAEAIIKAMTAQTEKILRLDNLSEFEGTLRASLSDYITEIRNTLWALEAENAALRRQSTTKEKK